ncbi:hypothetical protein [Peribacillus sp. SCS-37]|uniref:hypothetical protein n=1 Tax=Paraperibacillus esterisolvens TaxID=3115296 RepID=UPI00390591A0
MTEGKPALVCDIHPPGGGASIRLGSASGEDRNLFVSARELAQWGNLFLSKGNVDGVQIIPQEVFTLAASIQSPGSLPPGLPRFGFFWWIKTETEEQGCSFDELGASLPAGSFQILGASGCFCTVIPEQNAVAVRMYNSLDDTGFDYLEDIRKFGDMAVSSIAQIKE